MKKITTVLLLIASFQVGFSQEMGQVTIDELKMEFYEKDSTATAVILDENKFVYPSRKKKFNFSKDYYARIKIFDQSAFSFATFKIYTYFNSKIDNLEAITYNLDDNGEIVKSKLNLDNILQEEESTNVTINKFTLPNVKIGSVIEYKYTVHRNDYKVHDFYFQGSIPSARAEYKAQYYANYNVRLIGYLKPDFSESIIQKKCVGGYKCVQVKYLMTDIPAFTSEEYMTSKSNFISRLSFEEKYKDRFVKKGENSDWKSLDKWVKNTLEKRLDRQSFYRRKLPDSIKDETDLLKKAKKTFYYIQNHFIVGNNSGKTFGQSYKNRVASSSRINISLYNALKAVGFEDVKFVMLSSRENGLPTNLHATLDGFDSDLIRLVVNGKKYLLDATDKLLPFGVIPFESLNGEGRVFEADKDSHWELIDATKNNSVRTKVSLEINTDGTIKGRKTKTLNGYSAFFGRKRIENSKEDKIIESLEARIPDMEISEYQVKNRKNLEKPLIESYDFELDTDIDGTYLDIAPFLDFSLKNPFTLEERLYPVDYGYGRKLNYILDIKVPDNYELQNIPTDQVFVLPNNDASFIFKVTKIGNSIRIFIRKQIKKHVFFSHEYENLKEFYNKMIKAQSTVIKLHKKA